MTAQAFWHKAKKSTGSKCDHRKCTINRSKHARDKKPLCACCDIADDAGAIIMMGKEVTIIMLLLCNPTLSHACSGMVGAMCAFGLSINDEPRASMRLHAPPLSHTVRCSTHQLSPSSSQASRAGTTNKTPFETWRDNEEASAVVMCDKILITQKTARCVCVYSYTLCCARVNACISHGIIEEVCYAMRQSRVCLMTRRGG